MDVAQFLRARQRVALVLAGLGPAVLTALSGLVRGRPARWSFPGTLLDVPRTAGVRARTAFVVLALLGAGPSILMALFLARLGPARTGEAIAALGEALATNPHFSPLHASIARRTLETLRGAG